MASETLNLITAIIRDVRSIADELTVVLVANIKPLDWRIACGDPTSRTTEYLSEDESTQLLIGLQQNGFYTKFYDGEIPFLAAVLSGDFSRLPRLRKMVCSIAQSGTGAGRKSLMPAFCRLTGLPIWNSDPYVVSLARHKFHVSCIFRNVGIPSPETWLYSLEHSWVFDRRPPSGVPVIAKACFESASVGLTANSVGEFDEDFEQAVHDSAVALKQPIVVQRFVPGFEVEVPIAAIRGTVVALEPVSITLEGNALLANGILDYETVFDDAYGFANSHHLKPQTCDVLRKIAAAAFRTLGIRGLGRVDFRLTADESPVVTDVATSPHLVKHSSFYFAFSQMGLEHVDLMAAVIGVNSALEGWI